MLKIVRIIILHQNDEQSVTDNSHFTVRWRTDGLENFVGDAGVSSEIFPWCSLSVKFQSILCLGSVLR